MNFTLPSLLASEVWEYFYCTLDSRCVGRRHRNSLPVYDRKKNGTPRHEGAMRQRDGDWQTGEHVFGQAVKTALFHKGPVTGLWHG